MTMSALSTDAYYWSLCVRERGQIEDAADRFAIRYGVPAWTTVDFLTNTYRETPNAIFNVNRGWSLSPQPPVDDEEVLTYFGLLSVPEKLDVAKVFRWLRASCRVTVTQAWSAATRMHGERPDFFAVHVQLQE